MRMKTRDVAIQFRMGAGFAGDVNRTHPASIEPVLIDSNAPPLFYGIPLLVDPTTQGVRPFTVGDGSQAAYGMLVRPYPFQQSTAALQNAQANLGNAVPPSSGVADALRSGYIMGQVNAGQASPVKNGNVYVRVAATAGNNIQGNLETAADGGNNVLLTNCKFNGGTDSNNVAEVAFNI